MKTILAALLFTVTTLAASAADALTATWEINQDIEGNVSKTPLVLKQEGDQLSGSIKLSDDKTAIVTGKIVDGKITFEYPAEWDGNALVMAYTGATNAKGEMTGTVEVRPLGVEGMFTAKRVVKQ